MPGAERLHRGSKKADRVAVYTHRAIGQVLAQLGGQGIHRAADIPVFEFGVGFVGEVAATIDRRARVSVSVTERQLYLEIDGRTFDTVISEHRFD